MKVITLKRADGLNRNHRKESHFQDQYSFITKDLEEVIVVRIYGTQARNYCCMWVFDELIHSGSGLAGGYGYHRPSAAMSMALDAAGYTLDTPIGCVGSAAMEDAIKAIAEHHGWTGKIFHSHP